MKKDLEKLTKGELISIIISVCEKDNFFKSRFLHCISDLAFKKYQKKDAEADKALEESARLNAQYAEMMAAYNGKAFSEIPENVINMASALVKQSDDAYKRYKKLIREADSLFRSIRI